MPMLTVVADVVKSLRIKFLPKLAILFVLDFIICPKESSTIVWVFSVISVISDDIMELNLEQKYFEIKIKLFKKVFKSSWTVNAAVNKIIKSKEYK